MAQEKPFRAGRAAERSSYSLDRIVGALIGRTAP